MCGRFSLAPQSPKIQAMLEETARIQNSPPVKTGEIFPTNIVPVLRRQDGRLQARVMTWGFPRRDGKGVVFNARVETAPVKPLFRKALRENPVVVPATGFYEWKAIPGRRKKDKYLFRLPGADLVYLAGFAKSLDEGAWKADGVSECFVILTTDANPYMMDYHARMPILLLSEDREAWLNGEKASRFLERDPLELEAELV